MEEPTEIEKWRKISVLGSGSFGVVSLWRNQATGESIAIKKCKFQTNTSITPKQKQRWENEVKIMKIINHPNIISFKPIPKPLELIAVKYNPSKLPLLSMEYCTKGNLRHVLNKPENSTGLSENCVRIILEDISQGVSHLHALKITHRDIKPENIVVQQCDKRKEGTIYKLIDLGYAKELNDSTVSFVGTLHYLAPEIFHTENYNYSVDYWSLGVLTFEVVCGVLPFLPLYTAVERFPYIIKKKPEDICIYQLSSGSVIYSSEMLKENHISSGLKQNLEMWLRHVLQYDSTLRAQNFPDGTNVFDTLLNVLKKKFVTVFSVVTLEFYSYEVNESTLIGTLKDWIFRDTKVQKDDQVLLTTLQIVGISDNRYVMDIIAENDPNIFVFKKGAFVNRDNVSLPKYVKVLFESCVTNPKYRWRELRPIYSKNLFYLMQENKLISTLIHSFKLYFNFADGSSLRLKTQLKEIGEILSNVLLKVDCYNTIRQNNFSGLDCEVIPELEKALQQLKRLLEGLEKSVKNTNDLIKKVNVLMRRQKILRNLLPKVSPVMASCDLSKHISDATGLIMKGSTNLSGEMSCMEMVKIVSSAIKEKDKLLNVNKMFQSYAKATSVAFRDIDVLSKWMEKFKNYIMELSKAIDDNQNGQYKILFSLIKPREKNPKNPVVNGFCNNFDTETLIKENQELRYWFEESLSTMILDHKKKCDEISEIFAQSD